MIAIVFIVAIGLLIGGPIVAVVVLIVVAAAVEPLPQFEIAFQRQGGVDAWLVERGQEDAETQPGRCHGASLRASAGACRQRATIPSVRQQQMGQPQMALPRQAVASDLHQALRHRDELAAA